MLMLAVAASAGAVALVYCGSPMQRWLRSPLPSFPTRVSAGMAAVVALKAWTILLDVPSAVFTCLATLLVVCLALPYKSFLQGQR